MNPFDEYEEYRNPFDDFADQDQAGAPVKPVHKTKMEPSHPGYVDKFLNLFGSNKDKASNELAMREVAQKKNVPTDQAYRSLGRGYYRPTLNPEGRTPIRSGIEAGSELLPQALDIAPAAVNTALRALRGGDEAVENSLLDKAIEFTDIEDTGEWQDPNYSSIQGVGKSIGFSMASMVSSATAGALATFATANPIVGAAGGMAAGGGLAYRASKDEFLSRIKGELDAKSMESFGRPINQKEWGQALEKYESAAKKYGAWEAIPEAVGNLIFIKAFSSPLRGVTSGQKLKDIAQRMVKTQASEQSTELVTGVGQNRAELEAGLTNEELSPADVLQKQGLNVALTTGIMGGASAGGRAVYDALGRKKGAATQDESLNAEDVLGAEQQEMLALPAPAQPVESESVQPVEDESVQSAEQQGMLALPDYTQSINVDPQGVAQTPDDRKTRGLNRVLRGQGYQPSPSIGSPVAPIFEDKPLTGLRKVVSLHRSRNDEAIERDLEAEFRENLALDDAVLELDDAALELDLPQASEPVHPQPKAPKIETPNGYILTTRGKPFKSETVANRAIKNRGLSKTHTAVAHSDGFALAPSEDADSDSVFDAPQLTSEAVTEAANQAATSPLNDLPQPSQAQKEAGNYKKGKVKIQGLDISIENPAGSNREGVDSSGKKWTQKMAHSYGYIKGTVGADKDQVDVFIGDNPESEQVFVVDQVNEDGSFDEHKVMLGFDDIDAAETGYFKNYHKSWDGLGSITQQSMGEFKAWLKIGSQENPTDPDLKVEEQKNEEIKPEEKEIKQPINPKETNPKASVFEDQAEKPKPTGNKIFTDDEAEKAKARLKARLNQPRSGIDPEMLVDGIYLAGYHIEKGARTFAAYSKAMVEDLGEAVKPYLKSWYMGVKYDPRAVNFEGMDTADFVDSYSQSDKEEDQPKGSTSELLDRLYSDIKSSKGIKNNNDLKKIVAELSGIKPSQVNLNDLKEAQELYEAAAAKHRRELVKSMLSSGKHSIKDIYDHLVELLNQQPNLDVRTAKSSNLQAYSTPAPMAFLANVAAGIDGETKVLEPTAGNGLLLMTADPASTFANEMDKTRANSLEWSGYKVTTLDAVNDDISKMYTGTIDAVVANPPFGKYRDSERKPAKFTFKDQVDRQYRFSEIDHVIVKRSLDELPDTARASIIIGAPKEAGQYIGPNKAFLNWLYSNYNVVHHVEGDGSLYRKQGAAWPTQIIVIDGRAVGGKKEYTPLPGTIKRYNNWNDLYDSFEKALPLVSRRGSKQPAKSNDDLLLEQRAKSDKRGNSNGRGSSSDGRRAGRDGASRTGGNARSVGSRVKRNNSGDAAATINDNGQIVGDRLEQAESIESTKQGSVGGEQTADTNALLGRGDLKRKKLDLKVDKVNEFQAKYKTASDGFNDEVLTPVNMASNTQKALIAITNKHGSVDSYVAKKLGYPSKKQLYRAFMGLQADSIALAVHNIEENGRAIIIGDQTGVGKGRQAAGIIRYAMENGKIPVFVSQKANLFTDMYDDLADIGVESFKPLIMNGENGFVSKDGEKLFNLSPKQRSSELNHVVNHGALPDGYDALFLTYSQISSDTKGKKFDVLDAILKDSIFVLDESHTASGPDSKLGKKFQEIVNRAHGVTYLSATYAKRPENMILYQRTDLGLVADNTSELASTIKNGGLGMQTYIASKLSEAGQMIRRERSFDGININNHIIEDSSKTLGYHFDEVTNTLRNIQDVSQEWAGYVKVVLSEKIQLESGQDTSVSGNQADTKINVNLFSSVVHNYISQLTLGLKAKSVAQIAISKLKSGKSPVIALENTMGSALRKYMDYNQLKVGDKIGQYSFKDLLKTMLRDVLSYSVKNPGDKEGTKFTVSIEDVNYPNLVKMYNETLSIINAIEADIPASPIDVIRNEIVKAGYTVGEITGRDVIVDYSDSGTIKPREGVEKDRRKVVDAFNSLQLDVLIINQAGATGLSIHSKESFINQRQRHMTVAQPSLDINVFMQMLGRVNRTGQVIKPEYDVAWLDLPSETRPRSVLSKKMQSLNANTSGNTKSATSIDSMDILNVYGDRVVEGYVNDNRDELIIYSDRLVKIPEEDAASYFLGKLAVLPVAIQELVLDDIQGQYNNLIKYLDAIGQNELNVKELDLQAEPLSQIVISVGTDKQGVFGDETRLTKSNVKVPSKAPTWDQVQDELGLSSQESFQGFIDEMEKESDHEINIKKNIALISKKEAKTLDETNKLTRQQGVLRAIQSRKSEIKRKFSKHGVFAHGSAITLELEQEDSYATGVVVGLQYNNKSGDPTSPSKWIVKIALADNIGIIPMPLSQSEKLVQGKARVSQYELKNIFDNQANKPAIEARYIISGNLLKGQMQSTQKGKITPFTTKDGLVVQGMLMPKSFTPEGSLISEQVSNPDDIFNWLEKTKDEQLAKLGLQTKDEMVSLRRSGNEYTLSMPKAISKGKRYWGHSKIESIIGVQAIKGSGTLYVTLNASQAMEVVHAMAEILAPLHIRNNAQIKDYRELNGIKPPIERVDNIKFSIDSQSPGSASSAKLESWLSGHIDKYQKYGVKIKIIGSQQELPEHVKESLANNPNAVVKGYVESSGTVYLVADGITSKKDALKVLEHEVIGHWSVEKILGDQFKAFTKNVTTLRKVGVRPVKNMVDRLKDIYGDSFKDLSDSDIASEIVAMMAEQVIDQNQLAKVLNQLWVKVVAAVKSLKKKLGLGEQFTINDIAYTLIQARRNASNENNTAGKAKGRFSLSTEPSNPIEADHKGQYIDKLFATPFKVFGTIDGQRKWHAPVTAKEYSEKISNAASEIYQDKFKWAHSYVEKAKFGLIDRYGLPEEYVSREKEMDLDKKAVLVKAQEFLKEMSIKGVNNVNEAVVFHAILTGEQIPTDNWRQLSNEIRAAIDEMGQEAVMLGLISEESYQRNAGTYLHRVYKKHEDKDGLLVKMATKTLSSRRKKIVGNSLKGRGMTLKVATDRLMRDLSATDINEGDRIRVYSTIDANGRKRRSFFKPDASVPTDGRVDEGTWEVRSVGDNKIFLWRDFTKEERTKMGEILDARYTVAKTFQLLAHDLSVGRFYQDIAANPEWTKDELEEHDEESEAGGRFSLPTAGAWVKVPSIKIPKSDANKWGSLSGKYIREEIWRDLNEIEALQRSGFWQKIMTQWKLNKTARNPVVHMNNVMSNFLLMDMADVRMRDLGRAIISLKNKDEHYLDAVRHGAFGSSFIEHDINREVFEPILEELRRQNNNEDSASSTIQVLSKLSSALYKLWKKADGAMVNAYQIEDEIFRLALYHRRIELGDTAEASAIMARDQFINYDIHAPWINAARRTVLPFIGYTYRAAPLLAKTIADRPWKLAKYSTITYAIGQLGYMLVPGDEDEERSTMRKEKQGRTLLGVERMLRMPFMDHNNDPVFLDIRRWIPAGDIFDTNQGQFAIPIPAPLQMGGPIMLAAEFALNKKAFTGDEIINPLTDSGSDKVKKVADWAWKSWMPGAAWVPGSYYWEKIARAQGGGRDALGRDYSINYALMSSLGIKLAGHNVEYGKASQNWEFNAVNRALDQEMRMLFRDLSRGVINKSSFEKEKTSIMKKKRLLIDETRKANPSP